MLTITFLPRALVALVALSQAIDTALQTRIAPSPTAVDPFVIAGIASLMVIGLLLLLYFYRRSLFILYWIGAWLLAAVSAFLTNRQYSSDKAGLLGYGVSQFLGVVSALAFVSGAEAYRSPPRFHPWQGWTMLAVLIWFGLAPIPLGTLAVFAPGHLLMAGGLTVAGFAYLALLRETRLFGAAVVGTMLLLVAVTHVWLAVTVPGPGEPAVANVVFINLVFYLLMAVGMQLMTFEDMTYELRRTNHRLETAQGKLRQMVTTDGLTGCRNRRFFNEVISQELQRHRRYQIPLSMVFVDVNRFKVINDTLGHETGDRVLQQVAVFLMSHVRGADYVFRWGGDEFLILMSCREEEAIHKSAELQTAFAASLEVESLPPGVGLSVGCVEVPTDTKDIMAVVAAADERMYANKRIARVLNR